jgi:hypothetical protein
VAFGEQIFAEMRPEEAGAPGDEDALTIHGHSLTSPSPSKPPTLGRPETNR